MTDSIDVLYKLAEHGKNTYRPPVYPESMKQKIHDSCYIDPAATIIGDVEISKGCSIWPGAVIRADMARVRIGPGSSVQDNCVIHTSEGYPVKIGKDVSLGHGCMVHGAVIHDDVIIGINSTVLNGVEVGSGSIIGANAVVKAGMVIPPGSLVVGIPGKIIRSGDEGLMPGIRQNSKNYHRLRDEYRAGMHERYVVEKI